MRNLGNVVIILLIVIAGTTLWKYAPVDFKSNPCKQTLSYAVGSFSDKFGLTKAEFLSDLAMAEDVWSIDGHSFFKHRENPDLVINLIYDERQKKTEERLGTELDMQVQELSLAERTVQIEEITAKVAIAEVDLKEAADNYNSVGRELDVRIAGWNDKGGAPPDVVKDIQAEQLVVGKLRQAFDEQTNAYNSLTSKANAMVESFNKAVGKYNETAESYNEVFGASREFTQGTYVGDAINIFQYESRRGLRLAMAHELGHALGLEHVDNPKSVMYYLMGEQDVNNVTLTAEDKAALDKVCGRE